jgi:hypothetical protein
MIKNAQRRIVQKRRLKGKLLRPEDPVVKPKQRAVVLHIEVPGGRNGKTAVVAQHGAFKKLPYSSGA